MALPLSQSPPENGKWGLTPFISPRSAFGQACRRLEQLRAEGVAFETGVEAGVDISARYLRRSFDAICPTAGASLVVRAIDQGRRMAEAVDRFLRTA